MTLVSNQQKLFTFFNESAFYCIIITAAQAYYLWIHRQPKHTMCGFGSIFHLPSSPQFVGDEYATRLRFYMAVTTTSDEDYHESLYL